MQKKYFGFQILLDIYELRFGFHQYRVALPVMAYCSSIIIDYIGKNIKKS